MKNVLVITKSEVIADQWAVPCSFTDYRPSQSNLRRWDGICTKILRVTTGGFSVSDGNTSFWWWAPASNCFSRHFQLIRCARLQSFDRVCGAEASQTTRLLPHATCIIDNHFNNLHRQRFSKTILINGHILHLCFVPISDGTIVFSGFTLV